MDISGEIKYLDCDRGLKKRVGLEMGSVAEKHLHLDDGFSIVAADGGKIAGIIAVCRRPLPPPLSGTYEGFIDIIEVKPEYKRKGVARKMIGLSAERCREAGYCQLRAWSSEDKIEAIPMWKTLGFGLAPASIPAKGGEVKGYFVTYRL